MNPPLATERARSKARQLRIAQECGIRVPRTYIGNNPKEVRRFVDSCAGGAVAKTLTWYVGRDGRFAFTSPIRRDFLLGNEAATAYSPLIYQERVAKRHELRVTCVADELFPVRILSQDRPAAATDWRIAQHDLDYETTTLRTATATQLRRMMRRLGLVYGAFDLIVTPDDEVVFLEVNAGGNWLWLERRLNLPISERIASWLIEASSRGMPSQVHGVPAGQQPGDGLAPSARISLLR
jgi:glutathione synthase/RimK-type ligase-like ATP-grasp enzyme